MLFLKKNLHWVCLLVAAIFVTAHCMDDLIRPNHLLWKVSHPIEIQWFETKYLYLMIHILPLLPIIIACLHPKIAFYKNFDRAFPALLITAIPFLIWDYYKTIYGVWGFNPNYYTTNLFELPIEEYLFFFNMPMGILLIHEGLNTFFPYKQDFIWEKWFTRFLIIAFLTIGLAHWGRAYTCITFVWCGIALLYHQIQFESIARIRFYRTYLVGFIGFFLVNTLLTGIATKEALVIYNPEEYLGIRLITIPLDDMAYNFLLLLMSITLYDYKTFYSFKYKNSNKWVNI
jgi:lycopene cyclase domain-containing protein